MRFIQVLNDQAPILLITILYVSIVTVIVFNVIN